MEIFSLQMDVNYTFYMASLESLNEINGLSCVLRAGWCACKNTKKGGSNANSLFTQSCYAFIN
jgi:hypothetical protein